MLLSPEAANWLLSPEAANWLLSPEAANWLLSPEAANWLLSPEAESFSLKHFSQRKSKLAFMKVGNSSFAPILILVVANLVSLSPCSRSISPSASTSVNSLSQRL